MYLDACDCLISIFVTYCNVSRDQSMLCCLIYTIMLDNACVSIESRHLGKSMCMQINTHLNILAVISCMTTPQYV